MRLHETGARERITDNTESDRIVPPTKAGGGALSSLTLSTSKVSLNSTSSQSLHSLSAIDADSSLVRPLPTQGAGQGVGDGVVDRFTGRRTGREY
jgi:hypothetical protein